MEIISVLKCVMVTQPRTPLFLPREIHAHQAPPALHRDAPAQQQHTPDSAGDLQPANAGRGELPGVQVGQVLHGLVNPLNVIPLYAQH